jgi:DNA-directed RNA polymerase specialized sigma24 family protein
MEKRYQTGGADRHWLFNPQDIETMTPILNKLAVYDEYFKDEMGDTTLSIVLDKILEELPPELEEAVRLVYLAGISYRSAARTVGCDHKTIKARADRGIDRLRKRLTDTVWLASLINGMIPEGTVDSPKVTSPEKVFTVLNNLSTIRSDRE